MTAQRILSCIIVIERGYCFGKIVIYIIQNKSDIHNLAATHRVKQWHCLACAMAVFAADYRSSILITRVFIAIHSKMYSGHLLRQTDAIKRFEP